MAMLPWHLVADIGGTNARFAVADISTAKLAHVCHYKVDAYPSFQQTLDLFLHSVAALKQWQEEPSAVCIAIAAMVKGDTFKLTNNHWSLSLKQLNACFSSADVALINDFAAIGYAIHQLDGDDWRQIGGADPIAGEPIAVLGPGTGFGCCTVVPVGTEVKVLAGEGGHVDFAPVDDTEIAVLRILRGQFGRVSVERLLSGGGLMNIYQALASLTGQPVGHVTPAQITGEALDQPQSLSGETLAMFCAILGSVAGNVALTLGAKGGLYIAGGIVPAVIDFFANSQFRERFEAKGRFSSYLRNIPVRVVVANDLGLRGAAARLRIGDRQRTTQ